MNTLSYTRQQLNVQKAKKLLSHNRSTLNNLDIEKIKEIIIIPEKSTEHGLKLNYLFIKYYLIINLILEKFT